MKINYVYYILDSISENVAATFISNNDAMAKRQFEAFVKKLPDVVRLSDYFLICGDKFTTLETFDEVQDINLDDGSNFVCYGDEFKKDDE